MSDQTLSVTLPWYLQKISIGNDIESFLPGLEIKFLKSTDSEDFEVICTPSNSNEQSCWWLEFVKGRDLEISITDNRILQPVWKLRISFNTEGYGRGVGSIHNIESTSLSHKQLSSLSHNISIKTC